MGYALTKKLLGVLLIAGFVLAPFSAFKANAYVRLYSVHTTSVADAVTTFTSTSYVNYKTLTIDLTTVGEKKVYIFANVAIRPAATTAKPKVRFTVDGVTMSEYDTGFTFVSTSNVGQTYSLVSEQTLTAGVHSVKIDIANSTGVSSVGAENGTIIALQKSDNSFFGTQAAESCTGASSAYVQLASADVNAIENDTPHLLIWSAEVKHNDESNVNDSIRFRDTTTGTVFSETQSGDLNTSSNNNVYYSQSGVELENVLSSGQNFGIEARGGGGVGTSETCIRNATIVAIPLSDFVTTYTDTQTTTTFHRGTGYSASLLSITQNLTANDWLTFAGVDVSDENLSIAGGLLLQVSGTGLATNNTRGYEIPDRNGAAATPEFYSTAMFYASTTRATTYLTRVLGNSSGTLNTQEGMIRRGTLVLARVHPLGNAEPVIDSVIDSPNNVNAGATVQFDTYWTDDDSEGVKLLICKTNAVTVGASPSCPGGNWCTSVASYQTGSPISCTYNTVNPTDIGTKNYWAFTCDDEPTCSTSVAGSFVVITPPTPISWLKLLGPGSAVLRGVANIKLR